MGYYPGINWLDSLPPWDGNNFSPLEVPRQILKELGNPQDAYPSVHIAGTNGKGSVSNFISSILQAQSRDNFVGLLTSPHILCVSERARLNGKNASLEEISDSLVEVRKVCEKCNISPTYFVAITVATFLLFRILKVNYAVIEVGLGGRFDVTNLLSKPLLTVITSISFDHQAHLGSTLKEIAWNKAGIAKNLVPMLFSSSIAEEAKSEIIKECEIVGSPVIEGRDDERFGKLFHKYSYQYKNAMLAAQAALLLGCDESAIKKGLSGTKVTGRLQYFSPSEDSDIRSGILLDAAHNAEGVRELFRFVSGFLSESNFSSLTIVCNFLSRKDWKASLDELRRSLRGISTGFNFAYYSLEHKGGVPIDDLIYELGHGRIYRNHQDLLIHESQFDNRLIVCFGSFYVVSDFLTLLSESKSCNFNTL
ncbi:MAG TPA: Mur ligase family protein [Oligoflexia bacterium]|nr:Mur ligase family protein [Oligoflexia bacterium]HMP48488.1 Mur ligase family protein [Oligoflexia bacterium]